jgi:flagellar motility protein MotE (MotC chaperone)
MRKGDIIAIALVTLLAFPILYIAMLFATGTMRVEYGIKKEDLEAATKVQEVRHSARRDSLLAQNTKTFHAAQQERADLMKEQERLTEQYTRLEMLQSEIERQRQELVKERESLEKKMAEVPAIEDARYKKLARIYEAMKPVEAAAIMETLTDAQVAAIMSKMNDDRQKGRILSALSKEKAARLNRLIK